MREGDSMEKSEERNKIISKLQTVIKEQIELKEIEIPGTITFQVMSVDGGNVSVGAGEVLLLRYSATHLEYSHELEDENQKFHMAVHIIYCKEQKGLFGKVKYKTIKHRKEIITEADVEQLQEIKKLRLIGIPVQEIKEIYEDRLTLQEALSRRLDEIEKEERTLKETKLTCQKALKSKLDITSIDQLEIEEEKEEWQVRLAILLKEDIVQKKLSRDEMNNEIACFFIAGTILSVISIWLLPKDYIGTHLYVGLISLAAVVGLLIIGTCSANMKVHLTLLLLGAVVQPVGFFTIGTLMGSGYIVCRDTAVLKQYVIYLYGGAFILAIILWMGSKLNRYILNKLWISMLASLIMAGVIAQMLNQKYGHLMATGELIVGFLCAVIYLAAVSGTWTLANADWGKYNRYHAVYTSNKMINVFATIFNAAGYYSGKNWRR